MSLTCEVDTYNRVLTELLNLNIPRKDIFLLFGPIDVLIQFSGFKNLDEFMEKWFDPVRMIGAEEALITKTLTFIVISEGPLFSEEPFGFIFLNTKPQLLEKVQRALLSIPEVLSADIVFGPYDVICPVRAKDRADLEKLVSQLQNTVPGIEGAMTTIIALTR